MNYVMNDGHAGMVGCIDAYRCASCITDSSIVSSVLSPYLPAQITGRQLSQELLLLCCYRSLFESINLADFLKVKATAYHVGLKGRFFSVSIANRQIILKG